MTGIYKCGSSTVEHPQKYSLLEKPVLERYEDNLLIKQVIGIVFSGGASVQNMIIFNIFNKKNISKNISRSGSYSAAEPLYKI